MAYIGANPQTSLQQYLTIDDISGSFNGVLTSFALQVGGVAPVPGPSQSNQLLISLGGVIQEPDDTGSAGFRLSGGNIIFSSAPASSTAFFGVVLAGADYIYAGTNFPDGSVSTPSITFANDLDSGFYRTGSGELAYTSNGTFRLKIDSSGRLGVGTSSPDARLHVKSSGTSSTIFRCNASDDVNLLQVYENSGGGGEVYVKDTSGAAKVALLTSGSSYFTGGNVGVGTTSPSALLHVAGANSAGMAIFEDTAGTNKIGKIFGYAGGLYLQSRNDTNYGEIVFRAENSGGTAERMRIDSSGRVGIGTSSPGSLYFNDLVVGSGSGERGITVYSGNTAAGILAFADGTSGTDRYDGYIKYEHNNQAMAFHTGTGNRALTIDSSQRVGIGTSSPSVPLEVRASQADLRLIADAGGFCQLQFGDTNDTVRGGVVFDCTNNLLHLRSHNNETAVTIDSSERVGIGTSSMATRLDVAGDSNNYTTAAAITFTDTGSGQATANRWMAGNAAVHNYGDFALAVAPSTTSTSFSPVITVTESGNVGIGATNPSGNLHIQSSAGSNVVIKAGGTSDARIDFIPGGQTNPYYVYVNSSRNLIFTDHNTERLRIASTGAFGLSGANYGTSGQVLTSQGSGSAPQWATPSAGFTAGSGVTLGGNANATFSGIPSSARQIIITLNFAGPPSSQEQGWMALRVGTSSGLISSNIYAWNTSGGTSVNYSSGTSYIQISGSWNNASNARDHGTIILNQTDNHSWTTMSLIGDVARGDSICQGAGRIATTNIGVNLDRVFLFTTSGNAWATGEAAIQYI